MGFCLEIIRYLLNLEDFLLFCVLLVHFPYLLRVLLIMKFIGYHRQANLGSLKKLLGKGFCLEILFRSFIKEGQFYYIIPLSCSQMLFLSQIINQM